jgi:hypothetical protein
MAMNDENTRMKIRKQENQNQDKIVLTLPTNVNGYFILLRLRDKRAVRPSQTSLVHSYVTLRLEIWKEINLTT